MVAGTGRRPPERDAGRAAHAESAGTPHALRVGADGVRKTYGPVTANDDVSLSVRRGSVHAVVGENGAGKTTLMRILYGLEQPDAGSVVLDGRRLRVRDPAHALSMGVGLVQQELAIVPELSLLENLVLGAEPRRGPRVDWRAAERRADGLAASVGVDLDWRAPAADVSVPVRQQVEILRLLGRGVDTLILDEPTALLAPAQVAGLLRLLRRLRDDGHTVVFISHKLAEVLEVADEITVLRGGRSVATVGRGEADRDGLVELVVGERVPVPAARGSDSEPGPPVLRVDDLTAADDHGVRRLDGVAVEVRGHEVVGVAGVAGNGQDQLVECVVGLRRPESGRVAVAGRDVTGLGVARARSAGLAYISADRKAEGLALAASVRDNAVAGFHRGPVSRRGWLPARRLRAFVDRLLDAYGVRCGRTDAPVATLSGGNQQRLVVGRELTHDPSVLVAAQPTRGVDVKGIAAVHDQLRMLRDRGSGVLLVSEDLDELRALADRIVVLASGMVVAELPGGADPARVGRLMLGRGSAGAGRQEPDEDGIRRGGGASTDGIGEP